MMSFFVLCEYIFSSILLLQITTLCSVILIMFAIGAMFYSYFIQRYCNLL